MKKYLFACLSLAVVLGITACGKDAEDGGAEGSGRSSGDGWVVDEVSPGTVSGNVDEALAWGWYKDSSGAWAFNGDSSGAVYATLADYETAYAGLLGRIDSTTDYGAVPWEYEKEPLQYHGMGQIGDEVLLSDYLEEDVISQLSSSADGMRYYKLQEERAVYSDEYIDVTAVVIGLDSGSYNMGRKLQFLLRVDKHNNTAGTVMYNRVGTTVAYVDGIYKTDVSVLNGLQSNYQVSFASEFGRAWYRDSNSLIIRVPEAGKDDGNPLYIIAYLECMSIPFNISHNNFDFDYGLADFTTPIQRWDAAGKEIVSFEFSIYDDADRMYIPTICEEEIVLYRDSDFQVLLSPFRYNKYKLAKEWGSLPEYSNTSYDACNYYVMFSEAGYEKYYGEDGKGVYVHVAHVEADGALFTGAEFAIREIYEEGINKWIILESDSRSDYFTRQTNYGVFYIAIDNVEKLSDRDTSDRVVYLEQYVKVDLPDGWYDVVR